MVRERYDGCWFHFSADPTMAAQGRYEPTAAPIAIVVTSQTVNGPPTTRSLDCFWLSTSGNPIFQDITVIRAYYQGMMLVCARLRPGVSSSCNFPVLC